MCVDSVHIRTFGAFGILPVERLAVGGHLNRKQVKRGFTNYQPKKLLKVKRGFTLVTTCHEVIEFSKKHFKKS